MRRTMKNPRILALTCIALALITAPGARAQNQTPAQAPATDADVTWRAVAVKNVPPSLVAHWIDPEHNDLPPQFAAPRPLIFGDAGAPKPEKSAFDLPKNVVRLVPFDARELLFIEGGDAAGARQIKELVEILDKPLRQIEIEAQFVEISAEDAQKFGFNMTVERLEADSKTLLPSVGFVRGNFQTQLDALIAQGAVKVITAPRVTAINNMTAQLAANFGLAGDTAQTREFELRVTPTINGDETVTLLMEARQDQKDQTAKKVPGTVTVVNVRDGGAIALTGLSPLFDFTKTKDAPKNIVAFVTARIVRRADEVK